MTQNRNKIQQLLNNSILPSDITHLLLIWVRKELEVSEEYKKLDTLKFFCDWALHTKIEWSYSGSTIISDLHNTINKYKSSKDNDLIIKEISRTLLVTFKNQLKSFFHKRQLPTKIMDDKKEWRDFLSMLFEVLLDSPVSLKDSHTSKLENDPIKSGTWVNKISIIKSDMEGSVIPEIYCLKITTNDTTQIIIPLSYE